MWDLIVSVPDHCLSFYFGAGKKAQTDLFIYCLDAFLYPATQKVAGYYVIPSEL